MEKIKFDEGLSDVDATLSDCSKGRTTYSLSEFFVISSQCVQQSWRALLLKTKLLFPKRAYLFRLDPTNPLSVAEERALMTPEASKYSRLIAASNKDHETMTFTNILDLSETFHLFVPKVKDRNRHSHPIRFVVVWTTKPA